MPVFPILADPSFYAWVDNYGSFMPLLAGTTQVKSLIIFKYSFDCLRMAMHTVLMEFSIIFPVKVELHEIFPLNAKKLTSISGCGGRQVFQSFAAKVG